MENNYLYYLEAGPYISEKLAEHIEFQKLKTCTYTILSEYSSPNIYDFHHPHGFAKRRSSEQF